MKGSLLHSASVSRAVRPIILDSARVATAREWQRRREKGGGRKGQSGLGRRAAKGHQGGQVSTTKSLLVAAALAPPPKVLDTVPLLSPECHGPVRSRPATRREAVTSGTTEYRRCVQRYMGRPGPGRSLDSRLQARPELAEGRRVGTEEARNQCGCSGPSVAAGMGPQVAHIHVRVRGQRRHHPMPPCPGRPALCLMDRGKHAATQRQTEQADGRVFVSRRGEARHRVLPIVLSRADAIGRSMTKTSPDNWHWLNGRAASTAQAAPAWRACRDE